MSMQGHNVKAMLAAVKSQISSYVPNFAIENRNLYNTSDAVEKIMFDQFALALEADLQCKTSALFQLARYRQTGTEHLLGNMMTEVQT